VSYYFCKTVDLPFDRAIERVQEKLAEHGFGVLTTIDVEATLRKKLDADFRPYTILGACNPRLAYQALQHEPHIGAMLPCNVIVQQRDGEVEVAAIDPVASMQAIDNPALGAVATEVQGLLRKMVESL
jgi:uncharacterized protein (DUF302 family)